jgi:hypothetical protein
MFPPYQASALDGEKRISGLIRSLGQTPMRPPGTTSRPLYPTEITARTDFPDGNELVTAEGGEAWDAKMTVLIELVRHHVEEEEKEDFKVLKSELDKEELQQLGEALLEAKANYKPPQDGQMAPGKHGGSKSQIMQH